jgi:hypothetical protein
MAIPIITHERIWPDSDEPMARVLKGSRCRQHTKHPEGYVAHHLWMEKKSKRHRCYQCEECGLWAIWKRKKKGE